MENSFIRIVDYLRGLCNSLDDENLSNEDKAIAIIQYALLTDKYYQGSIILTDEGDKCKVSNIQKHSYAWILKDKPIDINYVMNKLAELDITYSLDHYPIADHKEDYEFSFSITKLEKKIKVMH